nr:hypothetical protein [Candidatus Njordarchaeum guaymaensis]
MDVETVKRRLRDVNISAATDVPPTIQKVTSSNGKCLYVAVKPVFKEILRAK